jgi:hypothetical protein
MRWVWLTVVLILLALAPLCVGCQPWATEVKAPPPQPPPPPTKTN